jgi:hypothetical protein
LIKKHSTELYDNIFICQYTVIDNILLYSDNIKNKIILYFNERNNNKDIITLKEQIEDIDDLINNYNIDYLYENKQTILLYIKEIEDKIELKEKTRLENEEKIKLENEEKNRLYKIKQSPQWVDLPEGRPKFVILLQFSTIHILFVKFIIFSFL